MWWVVMYLQTASLLKLSFCHWISAHGHVKSEVSIDYQGGVLTQMLQCSMVDGNVISFSASDFPLELFGRDSSHHRRLCHKWAVQSHHNVWVLPMLVWKGCCEPFCGCMQSGCELH